MYINVLAEDGPSERKVNNGKWHAPSRSACSDPFTP